MSDFGSLKDYITGASVKRLSQVECDPDISNQHELNGTTRMKSYLGENKTEYPSTYIRLNDDEDKVERSTGTVTWYDSRQAHPTRSEYRFYYQDNPAINMAHAGDTLAVILKHDGQIIFVSAPNGSQSELALIDIVGETENSTFNVLDFSHNDEEVNISKRFLLQEIGVEIKADFGANYLDIIEKTFGGLVFPKTKLFSELARSLAGDLSDYGTVDEAIIHWWDTEEAMFKQLEGTLIDEKLGSGFDDADDFLSFSQTIRQRRNSRAGNALENHLAQLFLEKGIRYSWEPKTENNKKPDFLFPSIDEYKDASFPTDNLTMLGVKTTCKDRWRQVLSEADRIKNKHLFTLQPKISANQTKEMKDSNLQLVIPKAIHSTYTEDQCEWLWDFETFVKRVLELQ